MPSSTIPKTIILKGDPIRKEETAADEQLIYPGMLVEFAVDGGLLQAHSAAGGNAAPAWAVEHDLIGKGINEPYYGTDHPAKPTGYLGDRCQYAVSHPGTEIFALLAAGQDVPKGAFLESAGDGTLREFTAQADQYRAIVARAIEPMDNSGGAAPVRIRVEVV